METSTASPSPPLQGYNTAGEEPAASSSEDTLHGGSDRLIRKQPKRTAKRSAGKRLSEKARQQAARNVKGRGASRRGKQRPDGVDSDLQSVDSLTWDAHTQRLNLGEHHGWSSDSQQEEPEVRAATPISLIGQLLGAMANPDCGQLLIFRFYSKYYICLKIMI